MSTILLVFPELALFGDYELFESYCERSDTSSLLLLCYCKHCYYHLHWHTQLLLFNLFSSHHISSPLFFFFCLLISSHLFPSHPLLLPLLSSPSSLADALCGSTMGMESEIQLVFFHPRYQFRDGQV
jgi:hypothetical protein